ncbi:4-alpha-glucanotransferase [Sphingobium ummariense]
MSALHALADGAGLARQWTDADGVEHVVNDENLAAILVALGFPADTDGAIDASRTDLHQRRRAPPSLLTVDCDSPITLPSALDEQPIRLIDDQGTAVKGWRTGIGRPGYYRLVLANGDVTLAVAPKRCPAIPRRCWGVAIQIPSLVKPGADFGDFPLLADAVLRLGRSGADAVALSPVHAQSLSRPGHFAPYSPSSRLRLNGLFGEAARPPATGQGELIDWAAAGPAKLAALRDAAPDDRPFATFLQANARRGLDAVQQAAADAGMAIGIITDLAVGVDPAGEDVAEEPDAFLQGLHIGAPPDPLGPLGQNWGLTTYSPQGLADRGFAPFIAMLRANIARSGGIRIDHAFGLQRLWVVPEGRPASEGAYLAYPFADLLRLIKLEAWHARAIVIAEDLGTRPPGFSDAIGHAGIYGMAVLPFSRDQDGAFLRAEAYPATSIAMSATHDTPTIAGWWTGRDLEWNRRLGRGGDTQTDRAAARAALWAAIGEDEYQPADPAPVIDRALDFLASSPAPLLVVPMEDLIGEVEQPNLPGTIDEHPNWSRRLPAPMDALLERPDVAARIARLNAVRGR